MIHEGPMQLALELARFGAGDVNPNPLVGAVIVRNGLIVGRGYHRVFGGPHAEVFALEEAADQARGATLYVTLEPCCHDGKTPPCTDRIIEAGISRVVVATRDPNPLNDGKGIEALCSAGIEVVEGVLRVAAERMNEVFLTFMRTGRPFVHLKLAVSLDGRIATRTGHAKWISSKESRGAAHRLRRKYAGILAGIGTILSDNPVLTVRHVVGKDPIPVVLDPAGRIPSEARLFARSPYPIIVTSEMNEAKEAALTASGGRVWRVPRVPDEGFDLHSLLQRLGQEGIDSLLIEGGGRTAAHFLEAGLVDKVTFFVAPLLIGGRDAVASIGGIGAETMADAWRLGDVEVERLGPDTAITGYPERNDPQDT